MALKDRSLLNYPDLCKWKPLESQTIDLALKWRSVTELELQSYRDRLVPFKGAGQFPFKNDMVLLTPMILNKPNGTVVEFASKIVDGKMKLVPLRIRWDKLKPNRDDFAVDIWFDINDPITRETIRGETFFFVRKYHNRIKRELLAPFAGKNLLDIGSGRGGDVSKWKDLRRIVAVEPNAKYITELRNRLKGAGLTDKVYVMQTGGEDSANIKNVVDNYLGGQADVISSMLSLSFFWSSKETLAGLVKTIADNLKVGGHFVFMTIDGDTLDQIFNPKVGSIRLPTGTRTNQLETSQELLSIGDEAVKLAELKLGPSTFRYTEKSFYIDIPGTMVEQQTEPIVHLDDLIVALKEYGILLEYMKRADSELFMSGSELIFTQMYTYGSFVRTGEGLMKEQVREVAPIEVIYNPRIISGIHDDMYRPFEGRKGTEGTKDYIRIACINDGSGLIHAILKGVSVK